MKGFRRVDVGFVFFRGNQKSWLEFELRASGWILFVFGVSIGRIFIRIFGVHVDVFSLFGKGV